MSTAEVKEAGLRDLYSSTVPNPRSRVYWAMAFLRELDPFQVNLTGAEESMEQILAYSSGVYRYTGWVEAHSFANEMWHNGHMLVEVYDQFLWILAEGARALREPQWEPIKE